MVNQKSDETKKKKIPQKTENLAIVSGILVLGISLIVDSFDYWQIKIIIGIGLIGISYLFMHNYFRLIKRKNIKL